MEANRFKQTTIVRDAINEIPPERLADKIKRTVLGLIFIGGAVAMAWFLEVPWFVYLPVGIFGAHLVSSELTEKGIKFVGAMLKDVFAMVRGKNGTKDA